jgi:hypothetical protein
MLMQIDQATLLVVDIQDKLLPAVDQADAMLAASMWLVGVAHDTGLPIVFSEQYPRGLGHTEASLLALAPQQPSWKSCIFPASPPTACPIACWHANR